MTHETALASDWLIHSLSNSSMARTKVTPRKGEGKRGWKVKTQIQVHAEA